MPHLIDGYAPSTDVFTRGWWLLALVLLAEAASAVDRDAPWWQNVTVVAAGAVLILAGVALLNHHLGRELLERPARLGTPELATFVVLPSLLPLVFGFDLGAAAAVAGANLLLLLVIYLVAGYGLVPMARWAVSQLAAQLLDLANLLVRTLPMLALFSMFLFLNAELWQVASDFTWPLLGAAVGLLALVGVLFTLLRVPQELTEVQQLVSWAEVDAAVAATPAAGLTHRSAAPMAPALGVRARANLVLVGLFRLGVQVVLVSSLVGAFYVAFGVLAVREDTIAQWTTAGALDGDVLWRGDIGGATLVLSIPLLKVACFLAGFAGLQVTVSALTDPVYRHEFFDDLVGEVSQVLAVRIAYLDALGGPQR